MIDHIGFALVAVINVLLYYVPLAALDPNSGEKRGRRSLKASIAAGAAAGFVFTPLYVITFILWEETESLTTLFLTNVLLTGQVEELAKFLAFLFVMRRYHAFREPLDAVINAAGVGLGFSVLESFLYGMNYGIGVQMSRVFTTSPSHMIYCVIVAVYWAGQRTGQWTGRLWRSGVSTFLVLIPSATMHGLNNYFIDMDLIGLGVLLDVVAVLAVAGLVAQIRRASPYSVTAHAVSARRLLAPGSALRQALARDPASPVLNRRLAEAHLRERRYPTAIAHLDMCLARDPGNPEVRALKGSAMIARGHTAEGLRVLELAALAAGHAGRRRLERDVLRALCMRTPATTRRADLPTRFLIVSTFRC